MRAFAGAGANGMRAVDSSVLVRLITREEARPASEWAGSGLRRSERDGGIGWALPLPVVT